MAALASNADRCTHRRDQLDDLGSDNLRAP
jgi:hypothetical protein